MLGACVLSLMNVPGPNGTELIPENSANQPSLITVCELVTVTAFFVLIFFLPRSGVCTVVLCLHC